MNVEILMASPDAGALGQWVIIGLLLLGGFVNFKKVTEKSPSHGELATRDHVSEKLDGFTTKHEMDEHKNTVEKDLHLIEKNQDSMKEDARSDAREIKEMIKGLGEKMDEGQEKNYQARAKIHTRVNETRDDVTELKTRVSQHDKEMTELRVRQDRICEERKSHG